MSSWKRLRLNEEWRAGFSYRYVGNRFWRKIVWLPLEDGTARHLWGSDLEKLDLAVSGVARGSEWIYRPINDEEKLVIVKWMLLGEPEYE